MDNVKYIAMVKSLASEILDESIDFDDFKELSEGVVNTIVNYPDDCSNLMISCLKNQGYKTKKQIAKKIIQDLCKFY